MFELYIVELDYRGKYASLIGMESNNIDSGGKVLHWQYMNGEDFKKLDKSRCVVLLSCSPLEVHGPHLPVFSDCMEAEAIAARTIEIMQRSHPEITVIRLPVIYTGTDVLPKSGSLMFRCGTLIAVLTDLGRTLSKQGFKHIWIANFHGGPRHIVCLEAAADKVNKKYGARMVSLFSVMINRLGVDESHMENLLGHIAGLSGESLDGDAHAGVIETSMMLHLAPETVDACYRDCPQMTMDIMLAREGKPPMLRNMKNISFMDVYRSFKMAIKYIENETYIGKPDAASPEIGREIIETLAGLGAQIASDIWTGKLDIEKAHSPLWPYRLLLTSDFIGGILQWFMGFKNPVF